MDYDAPSLDDLKSLRVVDLKARLQAAGLSPSGLKADLVARLHSFYDAACPTAASDAKQNTEPEEALSSPISPRRSTRASGSTLSARSAERRSTRSRTRGSASETTTDDEAKSVAELDSAPEYASETDSASHMESPRASRLDIFSLKDYTQTESSQIDENDSPSVQLSPVYSRSPITATSVKYPPSSEMNVVPSVTDGQSVSTMAMTAACEDGGIVGETHVGVVVDNLSVSLSTRDVTLKMAMENVPTDDVNDGDHTSCGKGTNDAVMTETDISNPIDVPVDVEVNNADKASPDDRTECVDTDAQDSWQIDGDKVECIESLDADIRFDKEADMVGHQISESGLSLSVKSSVTHITTGGDESVPPTAGLSGQSIESASVSVEPDPPITGSNVVDLCAESAGQNGQISPAEMSGAGNQTVSPRMQTGAGVELPDAISNGDLTDKSTESDGQSNAVDTNRGENVVVGTTDVESTPTNHTQALSTDAQVEQNCNGMQGSNSVVTLPTEKPSINGRSAQSFECDSGIENDCNNTVRAMVAVPEAHTNGNADSHGSDSKQKKKKTRRKKRHYINGQSVSDLERQRLASSLETESGDRVRHTLEANNGSHNDSDTGMPDEDMSDPVYRSFARIFEKFKLPDSDDEDAEAKRAAAGHTGDGTNTTSSTDFKPQILRDIYTMDDEDDDDDDEDGIKMRSGYGNAENVDGDADEMKLSKKKLKKLHRLSVAELKHLVTRPDVVEMHDVCARDPRLLIHIKSLRNSVAVPRHWCYKRKYLAAKRGFERPPFTLPHFIKKTGIMEMRETLQEKDDGKSLKTKMREKIRPKMGKIDIDYQKLHDAFFKWQTKPRMTGHGDLYYEGKETELKMHDKKPGEMSDELRIALGMPIGANAHKVPPPWLIGMQRYGPPPSYPGLRIPGLNCPIPEGCAFGYHPGGWGKPPVDEDGKPLYGDVFGMYSQAGAGADLMANVNRTAMWGEFESESEDEESDEEDGDDEDEADGDGEDGHVDTSIAPPPPPSATVGSDKFAGLVTPSGMESMGQVTPGSALGAETPELLELRKKRRIESEMENRTLASSTAPNQLYAVLPEKRANPASATAGSTLMGSVHTYDLAGVPAPVVEAHRSAAAANLAGVGSATTFEMALNPDDLPDLGDTHAMQARAEAVVREQQAAMAAVSGSHDLSDMVAEHAAKQQMVAASKRKRAAAAAAGSGDAAKRYREFKF